MKYRMIKPITGKAIIETTSYKCSGGLNKALKEIGFDEEVVWNEEAEDWIKKNIDGGIIWLIDNKFIKEDNGLIFDEEKVYILYNPPYKYKLHKHVIGANCTWNFDSITNSHTGSHGGRDTPEESIKEAKKYGKVYECNSMKDYFHGIYKEI